MAKTLVLWHRDLDGFGSAWAFWKRCQADKAFAAKHGEVVYKSVQYGEGVPDVQGIDIIYVVDFSFSREICDRLAEDFELHVIDHHESAERELAGAPYAVFNGNVSGAELTWMTLHPNTDVPVILSYVGDYDLYRFALPDSRAITTYLLQLTQDFDVWDAFDIDVARHDGTLLWGQIEKFAKFLYKRSLSAEHLGLKTRVIDAPLQYNEAAMVAYTTEELPVVIVYRCDGDKWIVGLRGNQGYDLSAVASVLGGGGHRNAAGFTIKGNFNPVFVANAVLSVLHALYEARVPARDARQFANMQLMPLGIFELGQFKDPGVVEPLVATVPDAEDGEGVV